MLKTLTGEEIQTPTVQYRSQISTRDHLILVEEIVLGGTTGVRLCAISYPGIGDQYTTYEAAAKDEIYIFWILKQQEHAQLQHEVEPDQRQVLTPGQVAAMCHRVTAYSNLAVALLAAQELVEDCEVERGKTGS